MHGVNFILNITHPLPGGHYHAIVRHKHPGSATTWLRCNDLTITREHQFATAEATRTTMRSDK